MKIIALVINLLVAHQFVVAQKIDTVTIDAKKLNINAIIPGNHTYIVYSKKAKNSPSERLTIVKINVEQVQHNAKSVFSIKQQWDSDTVVHSATTLLDKTDFSTIYHQTYWKRLGYTMTYDFEQKQLSFDRPVADSIKTKATQDFTDSFKAYNLNWHSDLVVFPLLPYRDKTTFLINYYDPGFGPAQLVSYTVTGSETLTNYSGQKVACWVLRHLLNQPGFKGYQQFWIDKQSKEVLKEEDEFNGRYRYKLKLGVSES